MTPGQHIEHARRLIDEMVDKHPLNGSGMMVYSDVMEDLDKFQQVYNRLGLTNETQSH